MWKGIRKPALVAALLLLNGVFFVGGNTAQADGKKGLCATCAGPPEHWCCMLGCMSRCTCDKDSECEDELPGG